LLQYVSCCGILKNIFTNGIDNEKIAFNNTINIHSCVCADEGLSGFKSGFLKGQGAAESAQEVPAAETAFVGNWTGMFETKVGQIVHTRENIVIQGCLTCGAGFFSGKGSSFNGYVFQEDLNLKTNSTRAVFVAAMKAAGILN